MKKKIRKEILRKRRMMDEKEWVELSREIQNRFIDYEQYMKSSSVFLYSHFDREVMTDLIIRDAFKKGIAVWMPYNDWERETFIPLRIFSEKDIDRTKRVPQPFLSQPVSTPSKIEIAVIPGVAFDMACNRIGRGGGFYDRFLEEDGETILKVSLAFDFQVVEDKLPVDPWDKRVDVIITEKRVIKCY